MSGPPSPRRGGGVKIGPSRARPAMRSASARSSGVKSIRSSSVMPCRSNGAGFVGNGWGRGVPLAGHVAGRDRALLDRPYRLAGDAVEDVGERLLAGLRQGLDLASVDGDVEQVGRGREVVVPQPVVHRLEVPDALARLAVDADDALGEQVVARPHPAVPVVRRRARGQGRRSRAPRRPPSCPRRSCGRCSATTRSASCRRRTRRPGGWCGRSTSSRRCGRRSRARGPGPPRGA